MQGNTEKSAKKERKKRSAWEKEGKFRHLNRRLLEIRDEVLLTRKIVLTKLRVLTRTLAPFMVVEPEYLTQIICEDERDGALFEYLFSKGDLGITPTEASQAQELRQYKFKPFHVTRRIQRMNRRLQDELGRNVADSHNRRWVITSFVVKAWPDNLDEAEEAEE